VIKRTRVVLRARGMGRKGAAQTAACNFEAGRSAPSQGAARKPGKEPRSQCQKNSPKAARLSDLSEAGALMSGRLQPFT